MKNDSKVLKFFLFVIIAILSALIIVSLIRIAINRNSKDLSQSDLQASTTVIGTDSYVTANDHNNELSMISDSSSVVYDLGIGTSFNVSSIPGYTSFTSKNFMIDWANSVDNTTTYLGNSEDSNSPGCFYYTWNNVHIFRKGYSATTGILSASNVTDDGHGTVTASAVHVYLIIDKTKLKSK